MAFNVAAIVQVRKLFTLQFDNSSHNEPETETARQIKIRMVISTNFVRKTKSVGCSQGLQ